MSPSRSRALLSKDDASAANGQLFAVSRTPPAYIGTHYFMKHPRTDPGGAEEAGGGGSESFMREKRADNTRSTSQQFENFPVRRLLLLNLRRFEILFFEVITRRFARIESVFFFISCRIQACLVPN